MRNEKKEKTVEKVGKRRTRRRGDEGRRAEGDDRKGQD